ncbi:MAG: hypothetical protein QF844_00660 [Acidimicrobiales bacterium]|jgi:hypothetical protein|nr:hypothetical protein [Acidimicrobiales bacterium]
MTRPKMTNAEKAEVAGVREYLKALEQNAPRRGRKRTPESVDRQIAAIDAQMAEATVTKRLDLIQQRMDLEAEKEALATAGMIDMTVLERNFVQHAAAYGSRRNISYAAWREVGVSSATLKAAGVRRSR